MLGIFDMTNVKNKYDSVKKRTHCFPNFFHCEWFCIIYTYFCQNFEFTVTGLNLIAAIVFTPSTDPNTVGFTAQLAPFSPNLTIGTMTLTLKDQAVWNAIVQPIMLLLEQVILLFCQFEQFIY